MLEKWPNFFIVGAPRAATTSLDDLLKRSEGVFMPSHKEPHYFSSIESSILWTAIRDKKKYLALFKKAPEGALIGESSTSYSWDPTSAKSIHQIVPEAKIIISLRDPVERAYSHYLLRIGGGITYSFSEAIKIALDTKNDFVQRIIILGGWYNEQVKRYLETFGKKQVKVLIFEEFIKNPKKTMKEIFEFLNLKNEPPEEVELVHNILTKPRSKIALSLLQNTTVRKIARNLLPASVAVFGVKQVLGKKISKPPMLEKDRIFLQNLYRNDVKNLQKMLNIKLPWNWVNGSSKSNNPISLNAIVKNLEYKR